MTMLYYSFTEWICFQITPDGNWYVTPIDVIFMPYISHYNGLCVVGIKAACKKAVSNRPELVDFAIRLETQPVWLAGLAGECFCLLAAELWDVWVQVKCFPLELCHLQKFLGSLPPKSTLHIKKIPCAQATVTSVLHLPDRQVKCSGEFKLHHKIRKRRRAKFPP